MLSLKPIAPEAAASVIASAIAPPSAPPKPRIAVPKSVIPPITWLRKSPFKRIKLAVKAGVLLNNDSVKPANSSVETPKAAEYFC